MKNIPAMAESIRALAIVFFIVLILLALGKFNVIPLSIANNYIEGAILGFGAIILFFETFREGFKTYSVSLLLSVITISATALLSYSKFTGFRFLFLEGFAEGAVFIAIAGFLLYELVLESTGRRMRR